MGRIRYIKPEFFDSEQVASLSFAARLLFAGLWTQADREGRFTLSPRRIKVRLFPYDDVKVEGLIDELVARGFVVPYEAGGELYGWLPGFPEHQRPHPHEAKSNLPEPPNERQVVTLPWHVTASNDGSVQPSAGMGMGMGIGTEGEQERGQEPEPEPRAPYQPKGSSRQRGGLIRSPGEHARLMQRNKFAGERVTVPRSKHDELVRSLGGQDAESLLMAWYHELDARVTASGEPINDPDEFKWLQREFERWRAKRRDDAALSGMEARTNDWIRQTKELQARVMAERASEAAS